MIFILNIINFYKSLDIILLNKLKKYKNISYQSKYKEKNPEKFKQMIKNNSNKYRLKCKDKHNELNKLSYHTLKLNVEWNLKRKERNKINNRKFRDKKKQLKLLNSVEKVEDVITL